VENEEKCVFDGPRKSHGIAIGVICMIYVFEKEEENGAVLPSLFNNCSEKHGRYYCSC
jgi:hypothetical protein